MLSLEAHGVDTVQATFRVLDVLPVTNPEFQDEIMASGFRYQSQDWIEDGCRVRSDSFNYQDAQNSTLRLRLRGGEYLSAEFSAPRLLDDSPVNLHLATAGEVEQLLEYVRVKAQGLVPGSPSIEFQKFSRLDYACDLAAGDMLPGVIAAAAQFRFPGARRPASFIYPGETATIRTSQRTFRTYAKAQELQAKLSRSEQERYANIIQLVRGKGVTRMELSNRTKGGLSPDVLSHGAYHFAKALQRGFNGGQVTIGGLAHLEAQITSRGLSSQRESTLIKFATRYAVLGEDGMKQRYSKPSFYRHKKMFLECGLRLDDVCTYSGEIDFRPVFKLLEAA